VTTQQRLFHMISWVAERYSIHPQTLRLYEREGNTRLYDDDACMRLEFILTLTRDLGVNLAGVEVILNMKDQIDTLQAELVRVSSALQRELERRGMVPRERALAARPRTGLVPGEDG